MQVRQVFRSYDNVNQPPDNHKFCPVCQTECIPTMQYGILRATCTGCGYIYYKNPSPAVSVLVVEGGKFLLCRRAPGTLEGGKWSLVGGFLEFNEDFLTAGIRETREETGLEVEVESILSVVTNFFKPDLHTLVVVLLARPVGGQLNPGDAENDQLQWFSPKEHLPPMAFEGDTHIIQRYFQSQFAGIPVDEAYARPSQRSRR